MSNPGTANADLAAMHIPFLRTELPPLDAYLPYLREIEQNNWYSNFGPLVKRFESQMLSGFFADAGALTTVANCTLGLTLALQATVRSGGKYVIMPSFTFAATPLATLAAGLEPYFVDVNADDWSCDTQLIDQALAELGDEVAAVMPYATFGSAIELDYYTALQERGMPVVIDAAPGLGATDPDGSFFAAGFPGCVVFSLHATKPFGIGEGGLVYSGSDDKVAAIRRLTNFGFTSPGISAAPGINAKMPEVAAAVGLAVLEGYTEKLQRLNLLFDSYIGHIDDSSVLSAAENTQRIRGNAPHQHMPLILPPSVDVESVQDRMSAAGIGTRRYFHPPCHLQEPLLNYRRGQVPNTDDIYQRILCLPLWDGMEAAMPGHIIGQLSALLAG